MFSATVSSGKRLVIWKVRPTPRRARSCGGARVASQPWISTFPPLGRIAPLMALNSVVFPAPFGPITARRSPSPSASETPSTARSAPKRTLTSVSASAAGTLQRTPWKARE
jgi:hypothetical protein